MIINWNTIDTVLLDMDGTLLDLNFDNHFWKEFVPQKYAELHSLSLVETKDYLVPVFKSMEGKREWYCLDYWSEALELDIIGLKQEVAELISVLPHVVEFLDALKSSPKQVMLVTNAHQDTLGLKMEKTRLSHFFDRIICSHDFGMAKEQDGFWQALQAKHVFDKQSTLLVDDSLPVLHSAREFGLNHLVSIKRPDSRQPVRDITSFPAIHDFRELMPV